jgi:hypothetical protein
LQASAVAGDGIYYCEQTFTTPQNAADIYIDLNVRDRSGNSFRYDNIWGFSTRSFHDGWFLRHNQPVRFGLRGGTAIPRTE